MYFNRFAIAIILIVFNRNTFAQSIPCNSRSFWAITSDTLSSEIHEYQIADTTVIDKGVIANHMGFSLAYCKNLNGGTMSPTLWSSSVNDLYYFNSTWDTVQGNLAGGSCQNINMGGGSNNLFILENDPVTPSICISKYNGNTETTIYGSNRFAGVADIAVDANDNVWFFSGSSLGNTDSIQVIDSSGNLLNSYYFPMHTVGAYGCFLLDDTLYIGMSQKLIPIVISNGMALALPNITTPSFLFDLASCNPGLPLRTENLQKSFTSVTYSPASNKFKINSDIGELFLIDMPGRIWIHEKIQTGITDIDAGMILSGIYLYQIRMRNGDVVSGKIAIVK